MAVTLKSIVTRASVVGAIVILLMGVICFKFIWEKTVNFEAAVGQVDVKTQVALPAKRGDILADDGRKLACSINEYTIFMDPCADGLRRFLTKR